MTISLLAVVGRAIEADLPVISAVDWIFMARPQKFHPVIDHGVRAGTAHQMGHREAMHHPRGRVKLTLMAGRSGACRQRPPLIVEIDEPAQRVYACILIKIQKSVRLIEQPDLMTLPVCPFRALGRSM